MSVSFNWEFEEEPSPPRQPEGGALPPGRRRRWLRRGAVVLVPLALAGLLIGAWVFARLKVIQKAEAELRAAVELELKAIADGDAELFRTRQDPTNPAWRDQQVARYASPGAARFAPAPGMTLADRPMEIRQVHLSGRTSPDELSRG
jgi:hypothetical protein